MPFENDIQEYFLLQDSINETDENIKQADNRLKEIARNIKNDERARTSGTLTEIQQLKESIAKDSKNRSKQAERYLTVRSSLIEQLRSYPNMNFLVNPPANDKPYTIRYVDGEIEKFNSSDSSV